MNWNVPSILRSKTSIHSTPQWIVFVLWPHLLLSKKKSKKTLHKQCNWFQGNMEMNLHAMMNCLMRRSAFDVSLITSLCPPICFCLMANINLCLCECMCKFPNKINRWWTFGFFHKWRNKFWFVHYSFLRGRFDAW